MSDKSRDEKRLDIYLTRKGDFVLPCDKDGRILENVVSLSYKEGGAGELTECEIKFYPCGWID